jgi:NADH-quinone oxidoreductase subunit G
MWLSGKTSFGLIGEAAALGFGHEALGPTMGAIAKLADAKGDFAEAFRRAARPAMVVGQGALARPDGAAVLKAAAAAAEAVGVVRDGWNGWNVLHTAAARVAGLDLGFIPRRDGRPAGELVEAGGADVLFLLGADEIDLGRTDAFVIYLGTHGDNGAHRADIVLPGAAYTEKNGLYVNMEGRVQIANRAVFPKGEAREDWAILRALSDRLGHKLPYDSLNALRKTLIDDHPTFGQVGHAPGTIPTALDLGKLGKKGKIDDAAFASPVQDFYQTNPIARASVTMAECSALAASLKSAPVAAE